MRITYDPDRCDPSLRLYNNRTTELAQLIHPDGTVAHTWHHRQGRSWHHAEMLPNGHLVAVDKDHMVLELDRDSNLIWQFHCLAHHDFARRDNGNTYVLAGESRCEPALLPDRALAYDSVLEVSPAGDVVWKWEPSDHAEQLGFGHGLSSDFAFSDWPHINTCEILPDTPRGRRDPRFRAGNLLLCGRIIHTIWIVDPSTGEVVWSWGPGELIGPHMPTMLANGNILIYDNGMIDQAHDRGWSRLVEIDPATGAIVWQYRADPPETFYSPSRGSGERLPNGNHLIAESDSGRLFEVAANGDLVWELHNERTTPRGTPEPIYRVRHYPVAEAEAALGPGIHTR